MLERDDNQLDRHIFDVGVGDSLDLNEPFLLGQRDGEWYFEGHEPLEDDAVDPSERLDALLAAAADEMPAALQEHVRALASVPSGVPIRIAEHDSTEVVARLRRVENTVEPDPEAPTREEIREMLDEVVADADTDEEIGTEASPP